MIDSPLTELIDTIVDNRGKSVPTEEAGFPLIATNCVVEESLYPVNSKIRYVSGETRASWFRGHPRANDILLVTKGNAGRVGLVPDPVPFCIAQDMVSLRPDPSRVYWKYLFAYMRSELFKEQVRSLHVGSLIPHFKKGDFHRVLVPLPEMDIQRKIGETYYDISLAIEINRNINRTLEDLAQALYRHWFVDFGPFQDGEFVDSELGRIPASFQVVPITQLIAASLGGDWGEESLSPIYDSETAVIRGADFNSLKDGEKGNVPTRFIKAGSLKKRSLQEGDIVLENSVNAKTRNTGRPLLISSPMLESLGDSAICASFCRQFKPTETANSHFTYEHLRFEYESGRMLNYQNTSSSGIGNFQGTSFMNRHKVAIPKEHAVLERFTNILRPIHKLGSSFENDRLSELRDFLLPRLLSGEITINDAV